MTLASFIELIAKIKQKNNGTFKLVDAQDVECEDGKGLDEVLNEKLDKNQGVENAGKTMVVGDDGNLVVGDSSPKNVYTKEEVDYLLDDKMDKPYVPIEITDNVTITDALDGNFKIDKIKGNTYQNVEENIVPTPQRPVPINSRKVLANGEYVELRSLKETINKFDLGLLSQTDLIPDNGAYRKIEIPIKLKPNTRYKIYYEKSMLPALTWAVLNIVNNAEGILVQILNVANTENSELEKQAVNLAFTSPADGKIYFSYYVQSYNAEGDLIPQNTEVFKEKWFTKILKNIMITEESLNQTTYVAPTVRDYKIVDHTNKTSKIVRNVCYEQKDFSTITPTTETDGRFRYQFALQNRAIPAIDTGVLLSNVSKSNINNIGDNIFYVTNGFANFLSINSDINEDVSFQYQLQTPTEESIPYLEDDTSEVGYSWQDTTSPSPSIKSEVQGVEEIDILKTGKNLFDIDGNVNTTVDNAQIAKNSVQNGILTSNYNSNNEALGGQLIKTENGKQYTISLNVISIGTGKGAYIAIYRNGEPLYRPNTKVGAWKTTITATVDEILLAFGTTNGTGAQFTNIQLEVGDTATAYEPYAEQRVNITLPQPLYNNDIVNVESENYEYYTKNTTIDFNRFIGKVDMIQEHTIRYYFHKNLVQELNGIVLDTLMFDCFRKINDDSDTVHFKIGGANNEYVFMYIPKNYTNDITYAKEYLSSLNLIANFAVETKTEIPIPEEDLAKLKSLKTEQGVTNIFVGGEVKPTIEARYPRDLALVQQQLEQKVLLMSETLTATQAKLLLQGGN